MATAMAVSDQQLESEMQQLHTEATSIRKKVADDTRSLEVALVERERIIDGIALGTAKESDAPQIKAEIERLTLRVEGNDRLLKTKSARINELGTEIARRQGEAAAAARQKEFNELVKQGEAAAKEIFEDLMRLAASKVPAFDAIRRRLGAEFQNLGGSGAAVRLREMLFKYPLPNDAAHDPNVHLRRLFDQGWALAGAPGPSLRTIRSELGGFESVPGGELSLTVCSLRPKK